MKFSCEKQLLYNAISTASRAAAVKSTTPALDGLLISAGLDISVTGYDLKKGIHTRFEADVQENGSLVLNARLFTEIVRNLPDGIVSITADTDSQCRIRCGKADYKIMGMDAEDYPELPAVDNQGSVSIPQSLMRRMVTETIFAISDNENRPVYMGSLLTIENGIFTIVSVDGYRLALRRESIESREMDGASFVVPGEALKELEKICSDTEEMVMITLGSRHISFTIGDTVLISRRIEGEFMDYTKSVPTEFTIQIKVDRAELLRVVDRVSLVITDEKTKSPVKCVVDDCAIKMYCITALGTAEDICVGAGRGGEVEIGFNNRYLRDAFKSVPDEEMLICFNSSSSPCVVLPVEGDGFLYMILPVRL